MKAKFYRRFLSALCALLLALTLAPAASASELDLPVSGPSLNIAGASSFDGVGSNRLHSNLYANEKGGITRVEHVGNQEALIEEFDSNFQYVDKSRRIIDIELPEWGGFYAGAQYNFLITGQNNPSESDSVEVIRIIKYDKQWNRLDHASISGINTRTPFYMGCLRCTESGGMLYIHTGHTMYKTSDGVSHQAGLHIAVRESTMAVTETKHTIGGFSNYVSHSLNQFIITDQAGNLLTGSHGDGHPRSLIVHKLAGAAGKEQTAGADTSSVETDKLPSGNSTLTIMGGLVETSSGYLVSYTQQSSMTEARQVKLAYISKSDFSSGSGNTFQTRQLTNYTKEGYSRDYAFYISYPVLVPTSLNGGYIIWTSWESDADGFNVRNRKIYYTSYDAAGNTGAIQTAPGALSSCQPILFNGQAVWYTTDREAPVFYVLDGSGLKSCQAVGPKNAAKPLTAIGPAIPGSAAPGTPSQPTAPSQSSQFTDLSTKHWAYDDIKACVDMGIVSGNPDGSFKPENNVTDTQFLAMMVRIFYKDKLAAVTTPAGEPWYYATNKVAEDTKLSWGLLVEDRSIYRFNMATVIDNYLKQSGADSKISSQKVSEYITQLEARDGKQPVNEAISDWSFVARCMAAGIITGKDDGLFHGEQYMTRAQACVVINRLIKFVNS